MGECPLCLRGQKIRMSYILPVGLDALQCHVIPFQTVLVSASGRISSYALSKIYVVHPC